MKILTTTLAALAFACSLNAQAGGVLESPSGAAALAQAEKALQRGDADVALKLLEGEGARHDGEVAAIAALQCQAFHALKQAENAEAACSVAIDTRVASWGDYNNRAAARMLLGDLDRAISDLYTANRMRPGTAAVRRNLARANALREEAALTASVR